MELFAGIGGFALGLERAGWKGLWANENNAFCCKVYRERFPGTRLDERDVREVQPSEIPAHTLLTAGFPCQDLSVAGKRKGIKGERSGLFFEIVRLLEGTRSPWILLENVPGLLSANEGRDFAVVLSALDEIGYGLAWRVLDAQHFGVPQRRRRIFIVGCLGAPCPPEILLEPKGGQGDSSAGEGEKAEVAHCLRERAGGARLESEATYVIASTLRGRSAKPGVSEPGRGGEDDSNLVIGTICQQLGTGGPCPESADTLICAEIDPDGVREASGLPGRVDVPVCNFDATPKVSQGIAMTLRPDGGGRGRAGGAQVTLGTPGGMVCECPDGRRYRALGNAVAVPVIEWIGRRLMREIRAKAK